MSNLHLSIADLNREQREDYDFYKGLGFNESQCLTLAFYTFRDSWYGNADIIQAILAGYESKKNVMTFSEYFVSEYKKVVIEIENKKKRQAALREEEERKRMAEAMSNISNIPLPPTPPPTATNTPAKGKFATFLGSFKKEKRRESGSSKSYSCSYSTRGISMDAELELCEESVCMTAAAPLGGYSPELRTAPIMASAVNPFVAVADAITHGADTESYEHIEEKGFQQVSDSPTSSFRTTCNTASIGNLMNQIRNHREVKPDSIRIEELMNFFDYNIPASDELFTIHAEIADKPNSKNKLLFVGVKGKEQPLGKQNIVLLLDTSGSMSNEARTMKKTMMTVVSKMQEGDTVSLITYSSEDHTIFHGLTINKHSIETIIEKMFDICITGCTNGSAGIETAYKYATDYFIPDGVNKVILMTDGDLNFGINSKDGLEKLILEKKKTGVFLSVVGMGIWNYKDDKLEVLAKNGNGNYCTINDSWELNEIMNKRYNAIIHTIAKDVKAQVEFNPAKIKSYRLLGYENRAISHTEFNDDKVIAEPFCSGSVCVAMYELEMADEVVQDAGLKYQTRVLNDSLEYCTVSVRYKLPTADESILISKPVAEIGEFSDNMKLAFVCYAVGEKFRDSKFNDLKDELFARYIAETMEGELAEVNGEKMQLLRELAKQSS